MSGKLPIKEVEKPWGRDILPPPFKAPVGQKIGEIWFEPPTELPELLVKYIFTSEPLSVQLHPTDAQTLAKGMGRQGKEECWVIVSAEPNAQLGIGFHEPIGAEAMRAAALDGSIEQLMQWHTVSPGDFFYIPANTVHAIGAGIGLIEVQQNSDITYRLYDYGRPRELHLDESVAIAKGEPYDDKWKGSAPEHTSVSLVPGPLFLLDQVAGQPNNATRARYQGRLLVIPREGSVCIGLEEIAPGSCGYAEKLEDVTFATNGLCLLAAPCS